MADPGSLSEVLVERGLVSSDVIHHAQVAASAADTTLAEALLELGEVSEDTLLDLFHNQLGFPLVDTGYFDKVDPRTLALIPRDIAVQHRVLPLYRAGKRLFIAAVDPLAKARLAEIAFVSGHDITVCVAKTSAVLRGLQARYQVNLTLHLKGKAGRPKIEPIEATLPATPPPVVVAPVLPRVPPPQTSKPRADKTEPGALQALLTQPLAPSADVKPRETGLPRAYEFVRARTEVAAADDSEIVGRILTGFTARFFPRVVLLAHRQEMLVGWQTVGTSLQPGRLKGIIVPLHVGSIFRDVVETQSYHIGPLPPGMINSAFLAAIGDSAAGHTLIVPILVDKKVATILYADTAGAAAPVQDLSEVYKLCEEAGLAFASLIRRHRGNTPF